MCSAWSSQLTLKLRATYFCFHRLHVNRFLRGENILTKLIKLVFPAPIGPTINIRGKPPLLPVAATDRYSQKWTRRGNTIATTRVNAIVAGVGENAAVAQLSASYHAITGVEQLTQGSGPF